MRSALVSALLLGCSSTDSARSDPFEACLRGARARAGVVIPEPEASIDAFRHLGSFTRSDGRIFHLCKLSMHLNGMLCPRGQHRLIFHNPDGSVVATAHYYGSDQFHLSDRDLVFADGSRVHLDSPGFVERADGAYVGSFRYWGWTQEQLDAEK